MRGELRVATAANGFAILTTPSPASYLRCVVALVLRHGFLPWGRYIPPMTDESVHPTLHRGRLRILAGWDALMGYHLLADSAEAETFLRDFATRRGASSGP